MTPDQKTQLLKHLAAAAAVGGAGGLLFELVTRRKLGWRGLLGGAAAGLGAYGLGRLAGAAHRRMPPGSVKVDWTPPAEETPPPAGPLDQAAELADDAVGKAWLYGAVPVGAAGLAGRTAVRAGLVSPAAAAKAGRVFAPATKAVGAVNKVYTPLMWANTALPLADALAGPVLYPGDYERRLQDRLAQSAESGHSLGAQVSNITGAAMLPLAPVTSAWSLMHPGAKGAVQNVVDTATFLGRAVDPREVSKDPSYRQAVAPAAYNYGRQVGRFWTGRGRDISEETPGADVYARGAGAGAHRGPEEHRFEPDPYDVAQYLQQNPYASGKWKGYWYDEAARHGWEMPR